MRVKCEKCGGVTNQPILKIERKIHGKRPQMPICKACYDEYRTEWDAADIARITKSARKTVNGREKGSIAIVKHKRTRYKSPIYVRYDKRYSVWRAHYTIKAGKKRVVPNSRADSAEEALQVALDYCRQHGKIDEELAQRYCKERGLPYYPPQEKGAA